MPRRALACAIAGLAAACGGGEPAPAPLGGSGSWDARFEVGPFDVAAGETRTVCTYLRGEDAAGDVVALRAKLDDGVASLALFTVDHVIDVEPSACPEAGQPGWALVSVHAGEDDLVELPDDVGVPFAADQPLVVQARLASRDGAPRAGVTASIALAYAGRVRPTRRAAAYRVGVDDRTGAPGDDRSARCAVPDDVVVGRVLGLEGAHGAGLRLGVVARGDDVARPVYATTPGEVPTPVAPFPAGLPLAKGDAIDLRCALAAGSAGALAYPDERCVATGWLAPAPSPLACATAGGTGACACAWQAPVDAGPGGSRLAIEVALDEALDAAARAAPVHCSVFRAADVVGDAPREGARAVYRAELPAHAGEVAGRATEIVDVTPGVYRARCHLDTTGGGPAPKGDAPIAIAPSFEVGEGATATVSVRLAGP